MLAKVISFKDKVTTRTGNTCVTVIVRNENNERVRIQGWNEAGDYLEITLKHNCYYQFEGLIDTFNDFTEYTFHSKNSKCEFVRSEHEEDIPDPKIEEVFEEPNIKPPMDPIPAIELLEEKETSKKIEKGSKTEIASQAIVPGNDQSFELLDLDLIEQQWRQLQEFDKRLLDKNDYQLEKGTQYKKKSAFRKYQRFFRISDEIIKEEIKELDHNNYRVTIWVRCWLPNGQTVMGSGACDSRQYAQARIRDYKIYHNTYTTAHTRAKNRAISDLVAGGEVSAEEIL